MQSYNMVLQNINVTHPCQSSEAGPSRQELAPVQPFDRAQEEKRMGNFYLEANYHALTRAFDEKPIHKLSVNEQRDFFAQLEQVLSENKIERRQHDFSGNKPSGGAPGGVQGHPQQ